MLPLPFIAYPAIGAGAGVLVSAGKKLITGKADLARCVIATTICAVAQAAFILIAATHGPIAGCMAFTALITIGGGVITKDIKDASDINNIALRLIIGAAVGAGMGYYGILPV